MSMLGHCGWRWLCREYFWSRLPVLLLPV